MEGFPANLNDTLTSTRGCAEPMLSMCQLKVKVTVKGQILMELGDVQTPCCPCVSSRSMLQLNVK